MQRTRGFGLIDVVVGTALMLVLFLALFGLLRASLAVSGLAKAEAAATEIANTQMEYLRGLSYDSIGTIGGIPAGTVPQTATTTLDGMTYVTHTFIEYYDDPADGLGANDTNHITTDYKIGRVSVAYNVYGIQKAVTLVTNFVPPNGEAATGGGEIRVHVVNASGADVSGAQVHITNSTVSPTVDFTANTNLSGIVDVGGAATSTNYDIVVSKAGYSTAQTYPRTSTNASPNPGYLTVATDQVSSITFAIDVLAHLGIKSVAPAATTAFTDTFADASNLSLQSNTQVSGGALSLVDQGGQYPLAGHALSIPITPIDLDGWGVLSAAPTTPSGTSVVIHVDNGSGVPLPDSVLPGNSTGFSSFPVSLTGISTSTVPTIELEADFTTNATTTTPTLGSWSVSHTSGPTATPNIAFTLTGSKSIGTTASGTPIAKTVVQDTTGGSGAVGETLEWDAYALSLPSANLIQACAPAPYAVAPGSTSTSTLLVGSPASNTLMVTVTNSTGATVPNARVVLTDTSYAATIPTDACGTAFFNSLASGSYALTASNGYATTTKSISVSGTASTTLSL